MTTPARLVPAPPALLLARSVVVLVALGGLAACGSPDEPGRTRPPASSQPSSPPPPTSAPTSAPTSGPTSGPSVAPASGVRVEVPRARLRGPAGFRSFGPGLTPDVATIYDARGDSSLSLRSVRNVNDQDTPPDVIADAVLQAPPYPGLRELAEVLVDGRPAFHLAGPGRSRAYRYEQFGLDVAGRQVMLSLELRVSLLRRQPDLVESVLASVELG